MLSEKEVQDLREVLCAQTPSDKGGRIVAEVLKEIADGRDADRPVGYIVEHSAWKDGHHVWPRTG